MSKKTCISPLRYLNDHTVASLCTIVSVLKYIYKIKKELCESEQWKYLNSKSALTLCKFEVKSLHSVRFLYYFLSYSHDLLWMSNLLLLLLLLLYELMFCSSLEYLNHCHVCFFSLECQNQAKRGQNDCFSAMRSLLNLRMLPYRFQTLYSWLTLHI